VRVWIFLAVGLVVLLIILLVVVLRSKVTIKLDVVLKKDEYKVLAEIKMIFGLITRKYAVPFHLANGGIEFKKETIQKRKRHRAERSNLRITGELCFPQKVSKNG
jgi:hypothetical protein